MFPTMLFMLFALYIVSLRQPESNAVFGMPWYKEKGGGPGSKWGAI